MNALATIATTPPGFTDWLSRGRELLTRRNEVEWELADWIASGRENFGNQAQFDFLADELGIAPKRLKSAAKVAALFPPSLRDSALTFQHHEAVSTLPTVEALDVLRRAKTEHLDDRETRVAAVVRKAAISPGLLPDEDWEQVELVTLTRAWNRARASVREEFLEMAEAANGGDIDA